jgi:hypothetical protein
MRLSFFPESVESWTQIGRLLATLSGDGAAIVSPWPAFAITKITKMCGMLTRGPFGLGQLARRPHTP